MSTKYREASSKGLVIIAHAPYNCDYVTSWSRQPYHYFRLLTYQGLWLWPCCLGSKVSCGPADSMGTPAAVARCWSPFPWRPGVVLEACEKQAGTLEGQCLQHGHVWSPEYVSIVSWSQTEHCPPGLVTQLVGDIHREIHMSTCWGWIPSLYVLCWPVLYTPVTQSPS